MKRFGRWFLPETPNVLGILAQQGEATIGGLEAFRGWAAGEERRSDEVRQAEHLADRFHRQLLAAVKVAFVTPVSPEDLYEISERLDAVLNAAKDLVREAEVLKMGPDAPMAEMAEFVVEGTRELVAALPLLASDPDEATAHADRAVRAQRHVERVYRRAMSALLETSDVQVVMGRRELYRRSARLGDALESVADRIWYAVVKER